ncbi:hypothetical protein EVAR_6097_1 [Eumeta japonica]|uniref:Uncharacterized protein n=1 Tax=Eumeta variegata TaxID=151549 RepID=A0A4C1TF43_EUMVA|nr:hypothetical protein EVAR_6097_1 [Eumeta japonica]
MFVSEAREICKERTMYKSTVSVYPFGKWALQKIIPNLIAFIATNACIYKYIGLSQHVISAPPASVRIHFLVLTARKLLETVCRMRRSRRVRFVSRRCLRNDVCPYVIKCPLILLSANNTWP